MVAGAVVLAGAVAVLGWTGGWPLAGAVVVVGASRFGVAPAAPPCAGAVFWNPGSVWPGAAGVVVAGVSVAGVARTCITFIAPGFTAGLLTSAAWLAFSG